MYSDFTKVVRISPDVFRLLKKESEKKKISMARIICEIVFKYFQNYDKFNSKINLYVRRTKRGGTNQ